MKRLKSFHTVILMVNIASLRLGYAFVEKEECSKEEKTFG